MTRPYAVEIALGPQVLGSLDNGSQREWLVTDGVGGFAMGTATGLATRRYHGLLVVAVDPPRRRQLALASLDPVLHVGDRRIELATHEWTGGVIAPAGHRYLVEFEIDRGVPRWRWQVGEIVLDAWLAMDHGTSLVGVVFTIVRCPEPVVLEVEALCTWRDVHAERTASGSPHLEADEAGFVFEDAFRVRGPSFSPTGEWYYGFTHREEAARGLNAVEDVFAAGSFRAEVVAGGSLEIEAWSDPSRIHAPGAQRLVDQTQARFETLARRAGAADATDAQLAWAADQFIVAGPTVVAGYPWFGDWSRDTMTSYEGLFLETGRADEGRALLEAAASSLSQGMLANTADVGGTEYNTVDAAPWFMHAAIRHITRTGDFDLADAIYPALESIVDHHLAGTRFGIRVDADGLITQGEPGWALTWMDARVDGLPITPRWGKPVEVNALWISGMAGMAGLASRLGRPTDRLLRLEAAARSSFVERFPSGIGLHDVVDAPQGDDVSVRPNQLLAVSLPNAPLCDSSVVRACEPLLSPLGLRSLHPGDPAYIPRHRGDPAARDAAYHQGTVWPWLIGPYVDACLRTEVPVAGVLSGLERHLGEWGLGSVSETADAAAPHSATGCPFQAWSVAEVLRARRRIAAA